MEKVERKKSKLLDFQKALNTHFLEIFESKSKGVDSFETQGGADLGLEANASSLKFFLPLKDLKNISMDNKYESIVQTNSWLLGFNQSRGEIYTIIDLNKVFELIIDNKQDIIKSKLTHKIDKRNLTNMSSCNHQQIDDLEDLAADLF